jgi:benzoyl-CoA reductase/2-hydroxyglutaryl-CoA dehydratase subunit BcrC/BadD/HgdB
MKLEINKELFKTIGNGAWRLTKHIAIKGIQHTVMETAGSATLAALNGNMDQAKESLKFDNIVGPKKVKGEKPKKKWFGKNKDVAEELIEEVAGETTEEQVEEVLERAKKLTEKSDKKSDK